MEETTTLLIEKYFRGELSKEELVVFEQQIENDVDFAKAVRIERAIFSAIHTKQNNNLKQRLNQLHQEEIEQKSAKIATLSKRRNWLLAASISILLGLALYTLIPFNSVTPQEIYAVNYQVPAFETTRSDQEKSPLIKTARAAYINKEYSKAIPHLENLLIKQFDEQTALVLGICYLESNNLEKAITIFQQIQQQSKLRDDATWFLAMTYLKKGALPQAKQALELLEKGTIPATKKRSEMASIILESL